MHHNFPQNVLLLTSSRAARPDEKPVVLIWARKIGRECVHIFSLFTPTHVHFGYKKSAHSILLFIADQIVHFVRNCPIDNATFTEFHK
jgi:hypothetical protein